MSFVFNLNGTSVNSLIFVSLLLQEFSVIIRVSISAVCEKDSQ